MVPTYLQSPVLLMVRATRSVSATTLLVTRRAAFWRSDGDSDVEVYVYIVLFYCIFVWNTGHRFCCR